jgi:diguanylate cyclase (GGDEF)-like protein
MSLGLVRRVKRAPKFAFIALILSAIASGTTGFGLYEMRADAIDHAKQEAEILATILAEDVANASEALDISLRNVVKLVSRPSAETFAALASDPNVHALLEVQRRDVSQIGLLGVADAAGDIVSGGSIVSPRHINISDREYFQVLRENPTKGLFISKPLRNKVDGQWMIFFARRIESADGRFLGVAFIGVAPDNLIRSHPNITSAGERSFSLLAADGTIALRLPVGKDKTGRTMPENSDWYQTVAEGGGVFYSPGVFDSYGKFVAAQPVPEYPFIVNVGITEQYALAQWRRRAVAIILAATLCAMTVLALLYSQMRLAERLSRSRFRTWIREKRLSRKSTELESVSKRLGYTLDNMSQGMAIVDNDGGLLIANRSYAELYGLRPDQLRIGMPLTEIFALRVAAGSGAKPTTEEYTRFVHSLGAGDHLHHLQNGRVIQLRAMKTEEGGYFTLHEDVTERLRTAEKLSQIALLDSLTGLPNRQAFKESLACRLRQLDAGHLAVLLLDIDRFKDVNDAYGPEVGDEVLAEVGRRLTLAAEGDFVARLGGDEFALIAAGEQVDPQFAILLAERLIAAIRRPIMIGGRRISLALNVGVKVVEAFAPDLSRIMRRADLALYAAKIDGRNTARLFDEAMDRAFEDRVLMGNDLRQAIENEALEVHYQPIVRALDREIVCMEALVRWRHPVRGMVSPATFIPIAEENGLIVALGDWVMRRACADAARWRDGIVVAVNVSALQIERPEFIDSVIGALKNAELAPERLQIEITESILLRRNETTRHGLSRLRDRGVSFALDDFGTGYASLSYLKSFQLDKLKIDKTFVDEICVRKESLAIVGAIVALARGLAIETTAEGVETQEQYDVLRALGVSTLQGYLFSKPKPIAEHDIARRSEAKVERAA